MLNHLQGSARQVNACVPAIQNGKKHKERLLFFLHQYLYLVVMVAFTPLVMAATPQNTWHVFVGSGTNQLLIPDIDPGASQVDVESSDGMLLDIKEVLFVQGQTFVVVLIEEKGIAGVVDLFITIVSGTNTYERSMAVGIVHYDNPGLIFEVHDIVFWQEALPLGSMPVFDTIIQSSEGPYDYLDYSNIPLTVHLDCNDSPPCTGHDFFTAFYKGYIIPPVSGDYYFTMWSQDRHGMWLSTTEDHADAKNILYRGSQRPAVGTESGNKRTRSDAQFLEEGKIYAFYAAQWIVHTTHGGILWEMPGSDDLLYIEGAYMMPIYDVEKPSIPGDLRLEWRASEQAFLRWVESADNHRVRGYNLYLDGNRYNQEPIRDTFMRLGELDPGRLYNVVATSVDAAGNESYISDIVVLETYAIDTIPPLPPTSMVLLEATGLSVHIRWDGASDNETEAIAYNIYVDGLLYNQQDYLFSDNLIIHGLMPETSYTILIQSVDASFNLSDYSEPFIVATTAYDPLGPSLGEKSGRVVIHDKAISWNHGIGVNVPYEQGNYPNLPEIRELVRQMQPGAVRWGAITANSRSFAGSTGTNPSHNNTYARVMHHANEIDAYFALTVGVNDDVDYMTDPATFLRLMEYLNGPASTPGGAIRASEGFEDPLLPASPGVILEFGNEVWGGDSHQSPIGSNYTNYAAWVREMSDLIRTSPYYDPDKIIMAYSGRYPGPGSSYGLNRRVLDGDRAHAGCLAVSGYLGGNLNYDPEIPAGESEMDYYKNGVFMAAANVTGLLETMAEMTEVAGSIKTFYLYESNMTTSSYNGRFGQAIVMTDYMVAGMRYGSIVPSIFHLTGGQWRITRPNENYRKLPLYITAKYVNRFCKGHVIDTEFLTTNIITDSQGRRAGWGPIGTYAFNNGEDFSILMINRDFSADYTLQLDLPESISFSDEAVMYTIWEDNFSSFDYQIDSTEVTLSNGMFVNLPKHAMVIIAAKGSDPGFVQLPLGYFDRVRPTSISVDPLDGVEHINVTSGMVTYQASVLPENAFSRKVLFEVLENTTQESIIRELTGNRLRVRGSGVSNDDGYVRVKAYAFDNHDLSEEFVIHVTNQGVSVSADDITIAEQFLFCPNPAREAIAINTFVMVGSRLEIFDLSGRRVLHTSLDSQYNINVSGLEAGVYIVQITTPDGNVLKSKLNKL